MLKEIFDSAVSVIIINITLFFFNLRCCHGNLDTISHIKVRDLRVFSNYLPFCRGTLSHAIARDRYWFLRVYQRPRTHHYTLRDIPRKLKSILTMIK